MKYEDPTDRPKACAICAKPITQPMGPGKPKRFCSHACVCANYRYRKIIQETAA